MNEKVTIIGGGLVGSLLSIFLAKRGFATQVFEKRPDIRQTEIKSGRSINLALSTRGWNALEKAGVKDEVLKISLPMYGRMVHDVHGKTNYQPYSSVGDSIYSVSRGDINKILLNNAENLGVDIKYDHTCTKIDFAANTVGFRDNQNNYLKITPNICLGTDGAFSELRTEMMQHGMMNYSQQFLQHGYKEIHIPAGVAKSWLLDATCLHIWPRQSFMLIALPNRDGSFTCTLFLHLHGAESFETLLNENNVHDFFNKNFHDVTILIPDLACQFFANPTGSLVTIECNPWRKQVGESMYCLLGDAAHAIVPFYGQGMNCGFEDCAVLDHLLENAQYDNWTEILEDFQKLRIPNTAAIAQMALENFVEMRDLVADDEFIKKKKFENEYKKNHPDWLTKYEMVTFSNIPYGEVLSKSIANEVFLNQLMGKGL